MAEHRQTAHSVITRLTDCFAMRSGEQWDSFMPWSEISNNGTDSEEGLASSGFDGRSYHGNTLVAEWIDKQQYKALHYSNPFTIDNWIELHWFKKPIILPIKASRMLNCPGSDLEPVGLTR